MNKDKTKNSLSPDVADLLQKMPGKFITYASLLFLIFTLTLLFIAWLVKYPDLVEGKVTIKTVTPPLRVVTRSTGELINIKVSENQVVKKGQVIAEVKSLLSAEALSVLQQIASRSEAFDLAPVLSSSITFGELQPTINALREYHADYRALQDDLGFQNEIETLQRQLKNQDKLIEASKTELSLKEKVMKTHEEKFSMYKELLASNGVSKLEFLNRQEEYFEHQIRLSNMKKGLTQQLIIHDEIAQNIKSKSINRSEKLRALEQKISSNLASIDNFLTTFQSNNLLVAPTDGVLSYLADLHEGIFVTSGNPLFTIVPEEELFYGTVQVSQKGFGKIAKGQKVIIEHEQYASAEYGVMSGTVEDISLLQLDNNYRIRVSLSNETITNFGKDLNLPPESYGNAKIITEDIRLIERLFYNFRKVTSLK